MNRVNAVGRPARQRARAAERRRRGLPPRRRGPALTPSGLLRSVRPGASARPTAGHPTRLLGSRPPAVSLAPRATTVTDDRTLRPSPALEVEAPRPTRPSRPAAPAGSAPSTAPPTVPPAATGDDVPAVAVPPAVQPAAVVVPAAVVPAVVVRAAVPAPAATPGPAVAAGPQAPRRRPRRALALAGAAVVVVAVGGTVAGVAATRSSPSATAVRAAAPDVSALATWLRDNVAADARIVSDDPAVTIALATRDVGVTAVAAPAAAGTGDYVVGRSGPGDPAPRVVAEGRALVPVARFSVGGAGVEVGQLVARTAEDVVADRRAERDTTGTATAGLLANPALTVDPPARPAFAAGGLDLRTAAFLAVLAGTQPVRVLAVAQDPAELAAGRPARRVVVAVADPDALRRAVGNVPTSYAPTVSAADPATGYPPHSVLLTWSVLADPTLVVS